MTHTPSPKQYQTELRFPGCEPQTVATTGTAAEHTRAVRSAVDARYTALRDEINARHAAACDAYYAAESGITYQAGRTPQPQAEQDRLRAKRSTAYKRMQETTPDPKRMALLEAWVLPDNSSGVSPAQARRAYRASLLRKAPQPSTAAFSPGSWVRWNDPLDGRLRFGVVVSDISGATGVAYTKNARYIVPNDGGDIVTFGPGFARTVAEGRWEIYGVRPDFPTIDSYTGARVVPALVQDTLDGDA